MSPPLSRYDMVGVQKGAVQPPQRPQNGGLEEVPRSPSGMDEVLNRMSAKLAKMDSSRGSTVGLPRAELELLAQIEISRDFMMDILRKQGERQLLQDIFGGDCARIARLRVLCESVEFSEMNAGDQRLKTCLSACESMEQVLKDLGLDESLCQAQTRERAILKDLDLDESLRETQTGGNVDGIFCDGPSFEHAAWTSVAEGRTIDLDAKGVPVMDSTTAITKKTLDERFAISSKLSATVGVTTTLSSSVRRPSGMRDFL